VAVAFGQNRTNILGIVLSFSELLRCAAGYKETNEIYAILKELNIHYVQWVE
jgi:hypothetical protein